MASELGENSFAGFAVSALDQLTGHSWPGNVRELKNTVERAVHRAARLDLPIVEITLDPFASPYRPVAVPAADPKAAVPTDDASPAAPSLDDPFSLHDRVRDFERELLARSYERNRHSQRKTAEFLGISYHQLRRYLKKHKLVNLSQ
jgi:psp operon transcriptional activator